MTGHDNLTIRSKTDQVAQEYYHHSSGQRINTDAVVAEALRFQYPELQLIIAPQQINFSLLAFAGAGFASATPLEDPHNSPVYGVALKWRIYAPPARRLDRGNGAIVDSVLFGKYLYKWEGHEFLLYVVNGRDGSVYSPHIAVHYILSNETEKVNELIKQATVWGYELHDEVWVFDQGFWQKSRELWQSVEKSRWEDVILEEEMKEAIINDVENFFDGRDTYGKLKVPWKRGIIYYGPPGNGKTISIKAMMHSLYQRGRNTDSRQTVPTLYVRSLVSFGGPEYALKLIFGKARQTAPCYLVFEDLDSIVSDQVRSYFLNEVDGLKSNDGILMVGSTNHLDRLDPGISKRPSRFDRKYYFPDPDFKQRVAYAKYWQKKLEDNEDVEFPDSVCEAVARITDKFSFAYIQEAFVAALLAIASRSDKGKGPDVNKWAGPEDPLSSVNKIVSVTVTDGKDDPDLDKLVLWRELKKQVKILRDEMDEKEVKERVGFRAC